MKKLLTILGIHLVGYTFGYCVGAFDVAWYITAGVGFVLGILLFLVGDRIFDFDR